MRILAILLLLVGCATGGIQRSAALAENAFDAEQPEVLQNDGSVEIKYVKNLDGGVKFSIINRGEKSEEVKIPFSEIGIGGAFRAHDVLQQEDEGTVWGEYRAEVEPGEGKVIELKRIKCIRCE